MRVTVHSYNILSSQLATKGFFPQCQPAYLQSNYRLGKVLQKLEESVESKAIICLQEVSVDWVSKFSRFFTESGYNFIPSLYGQMGTTIAYPNKHYNLLNCDITCIAKTKDWNVNSNFFQKFFHALKQKLFGISINGNENPWIASKLRNNTLIHCKLLDQQTGQAICVANYHMPCAFKNPPVMLIHGALAAQHVQKLSGTLPYIFAGDFNFKPDSTPYQLYTGAGVPTNHPDCPPPLYPGDSWSPELPSGPMKSAYFTLNNKEPEYTTYTGSLPSFVGTLDYIFHSSHFLPTEVVPIPEFTEVLPNENEPSDHFLIGASFQYEPVPLPAT